MDDVGVLANASGSTLTKLVANSGCFLCGTIQSDSGSQEDMTSLSGKVADLRQRICDSLDITLAGIQLNGYIAAFVGSISAVLSCLVCPSFHYQRLIIEPIENGAFRERWRQDNHVTTMTEFSSNKYPK